MVIVLDWPLSYFTQHQQYMDIIWHKRKRKFTNTIEHDKTYTTVAQIDAKCSQTALIFGCSKCL